MLTTFSCKLSWKMSEKRNLEDDDELAVWTIAQVKKTRRKCVKSQI